MRACAGEWRPTGAGPYAESSSQSSCRCPVNPVNPVRKQLLLSCPSCGVILSEIPDARTDIPIETQY